MPAGLIGSELFTMLLSAILTMAMTAPLLTFAGRQKHEAPVAGASSLPD